MYGHRKVAANVNSGRKIPCRTEESNLRQRRACPMVDQRSYIASSSLEASKVHNYDDVLEKISNNAVIMSNDVVIITNIRT